MNTTVFLNEPEYSTLTPKQQYDEDIKTIAKWILAYDEEIIPCIK